MGKEHDSLEELKNTTLDRKTLEQLLVKAHNSTKNLHTKHNKKHKHEYLTPKFLENSSKDWSEEVSSKLRLEDRHISEQLYPIRWNTLVLSQVAQQ